MPKTWPEILEDLVGYVNAGAEVASTIDPAIAPVTGIIEYLTGIVGKAAAAHLAITGQPMDPASLTHIDEVPE